MKMNKTKHLDIGCGGSPRNPYGQEELFGIDNYVMNENIRRANLAIDKIPFDDNYFDSISAFDVLEHIPRQAVDYQKKEIRFPFIELMQEIWRVSKPGGKFYAITPAYPAPEAFQDPTHVNYITVMTHSYFCEDSPHAARYGFTGRFEVINVGMVVTKDAYEPGDSFRKKLRLWHRTYFKRSGLSHLLWELRVVK
jgi:SAM-dependent methyltransferase